MKHIKLFENFNEPEQFCEYCLDPVDIKLFSYPEKKSFIETGLCPKCLAAKNYKKFNSETTSFEMSDDDYPQIGKNSMDLDSNVLSDLEGIVERAMNYPVTKEGYFRFWGDFFKWEKSNNYYGGTTPFTFRVKLIWDKKTGTSSNKEYKSSVLMRDQQLRIGIKLLDLRRRFRPIWEEYESSIQNMNPDISPNTIYADELNRLEVSIKGKYPESIIHNWSNEDRKEAYLSLKRNALRRVGLANRDKLKKDLESGEYFKNLSKKEIEYLMDDALDTKDFKTAAILRDILYPEQP